MNFEKLNQHLDDQSAKDAGYVSQSAQDILGVLEPLVEDSQRTAIRFDEQIREKKRLLKGLNDALDSRVISINLLLSRADALQKKLEENQNHVNPAFVMPEKPGMNSAVNPLLDQQNQIIDMYQKKMDVDTIARQLSIPKGEIQLVIGLKKKFLAMEKSYR